MWVGGCIHLFTCEHVGPCMYIWRLQINLRYRSSDAIHLGFFEMRSPTGIQGNVD